MVQTVNLNCAKKSIALIGLNIFFFVYSETKRTHLDAAVFRLIGSIHNCTKDDIHKSSLLDLPK